MVDKLESLVDFLDPLTALGRTTDESVQNVFHRFPQHAVAFRCPDAAVGRPCGNCAQEVTFALCHTAHVRQQQQQYLP